MDKRADGCTLKHNFLGGGNKSRMNVTPPLFSITTEFMWLISHSQINLQ